MDVLKGPQTRYTGMSDDDVPKGAPIFGHAPVGNDRRTARFGRNGGVAESQQQLLINALRGRVVPDKEALNRKLADQAATLNFEKQKYYNYE